MRKGASSGVVCRVVWWMYHFTTIVLSDSFSGWVFELGRGVEGETYHRRLGRG